MFHVAKWCLLISALGLIVLAQPVQCQSPTHLWSMGFGDTGYDYGWGTAVDASGNVFLAGSFEGTVDFGGGSLTSFGGSDAVVAKFNALGGHLWSMRFGGSGYDQCRGVAVDVMGNVVVTGMFAGTVDFGGGPLTSAGDSDVFVAKYDPNGNHIWSRKFGNTNADEGSGIVTDGYGNVLVTGSFGGTVDFGGGSLTSNGFVDIFLAKYDPSGSHLWSKSFGGSDEDAGRDVAVDGLGNVIVTGYFEGNVDFGGAPLTSSGYDIFLAKYDADGNHHWSKSFGGEDAGDSGRGVAVDGAGNVVVTGSFYGSADFGGGPLTSAGDSDIFVAKFDPNGVHAWSMNFGDWDADSGIDIAVDGLQNVFVTGYFRETVDFGGGPLTSVAYSDIFVAKYTPTGSHLWSMGFGDAGTDIGNGVALDGSGDVHLTGFHGGMVDFGGGSLASAGGSDIFIAKFTFGTVPTLCRSFNTAQVGGVVTVSWELAELDRDAIFSVLRKKGSREHFLDLKGAEITQNGLVFRFVDTDIDPGTTYTYRVDVERENESWILFETEPILTQLPSLSLETNYPNPFNPVTCIPFVIDKAGGVRLAIYDSSGHLVRVLVNHDMAPGVYAEEWDGRDSNGKAVASGVYFYRLTVGKRSLARKALLLK